MAIDKKEGRRFFTYDFTIRGHRFSGSTGATERREAERVERQKRIDAEIEVRRRESLAQQATKELPPTLDLIVGRYWQEKAQFYAAPKTEFTNLERVISFFGATTRLTDITDDQMAKFVAERRAEPVARRVKTHKIVEPATVNRTTVDVMRKIFTYAKDVLKVTSPNEPRWSKHKLKERGEMIRELRPSEEERFRAALWPGYRDTFAYALASGMRLDNCLLRWSEVDFEIGQIVVIQKGGRRHMIPMSAEMRAILTAQVGKHPEWVFTLPARRALKARGVAKGDLIPVTYEGLKSEWKRVRARLGLGDVRFHDLRHTRASRVLRASGNLKLAQRLLGHADVSTTATYYAHVTNDDIVKALDEEFNNKTPYISPYVTQKIAEK